MREVDRKECAAFGRGPKQALRFSLRTALHAMTAVEDDGTPVAMFGLFPISTIAGEANPWFLGTDKVFDHPRELLVIGGRVLAWWRSEYPNLSNLVAAENVRAIRLLRHWGFDVGGKETMIGGVAFVPFHFPAIQAQARAA